MSLNVDELVCPKFQPNIFNSSRCLDCLRLKHLHTVCAPTHTPEQVKANTDRNSSAPPRDTKEMNNKEDSDAVSVVSSYCDVSGGSLCNLDLCDGDDDCSTDSEGKDKSDSRSSTSTDEDSLDLHHSRMTRLDRPPQRPSPNVWMKEARGQHNLTRSSSPSHGGSMVTRERDSGYFSLGRAGGSKTFRDKSPPPPHRHSERGHPLPTNHAAEPKATIPFRNPDLGVPSERRTSEIQNLDLDPEMEAESLCLDPVDLSIEVEAQVGPRSPSPTPFKQAESLALSSRRGPRASSGSSSFNTFPRAFASSRQSSVPSRSSSPGRAPSTSHRAEPVSVPSSRGAATRQGLKSDTFTRRSSSPGQGSCGRPTGSGALQRNFQAFASTVGIISNTAKTFTGSSHLRDGSHQTEGRSGRGSTRTSSPSKWSSDVPDHSFVRKSSNSPNSQRHESRSPSPSRRSYERSNQSFLQKAEGRRSASPIRKGYGATSQSETNHISDGWSHQNTSSSPSRRTFESASQSLRKSDTSNPTRCYSHDSLNSSPTRRSYDTSSQPVLRKTETSRSSFSRGLDSRSPSPSRRSYDTSSQSLPHKSQISNPIRSHNGDSRNSSPSRRSYDTSSQSLPHKSQISNPIRSQNGNSRNSSPTRQSYDTSSQSLPHKSQISNPIRSHNGDSRNSSPTRRSYDTSSQSLPHKSQISNPIRSQNGNSRNSSPTRRSYDTSSQSLPHKSQISNPIRSHNGDSRNSSPTRRSYDTSSQSLPHKSQISSGQDSLSYARQEPAHQSFLSNSRAEPFRAGHSRTEPFRTEHSRSTHSRAEPFRPEPFRGEPSRSTHYRAEPFRAEPFRTEPSRAEPSRAEPFRTEHSRSTHSRAEPFRGEPSRAEPFRTEHSRVEPFRGEPSRAEPFRTENSRVEPFRGEPSRAEPFRTEHSRVEPFRAEASSYMGRSGHNSAKPDSQHTTGSWQGSTHSLNSLSISRSSSPSRKDNESKAIGYSKKPAHIAWETIQNTTYSRPGKEATSPSANSRSSHLRRSHTPQMQSHTSSQSSMESSESGHVSASSCGLNREEYTMMADLPKRKPLLQREEPSHLERPEPRIRDEPSLYKPASHSHSRAVHSAWEEPGDQRRPRSTSPPTQMDSSPTIESKPSMNQYTEPAHSQQGSRPPVCIVSCRVDHAEDDTIQKPDLLNFKKGWMSKLDESGEWKKHWFVLTDAGLKYYRDSGAEEKDELDGEVDLRSCVRVSEFDVDRNYGFQIQTERGVVTLSAMTAGIRRNWIEVLRKSIGPINSPDLTQLPDSSSDKLNSRHTPSRRLHPQSEPTTSTHRRFDYVELSPLATPPSPAPSNQREAGEGQVRELGPGQEERGRDDCGEASLVRKALGRTSEQKRIEEEIEQKWAEFERLPLKQMRSLPVPGLRSGPLANEALQREVASLRLQLESVRGDGGVGGGVCVGGAGDWSVCLEQLESVHREALEELQRQHVHDVEELEKERTRVLEEETRATVCAMEALKKAHQEELEREVQKAKRLAVNTVDTHTLRDPQQVEVMSLRRELQTLSEQYTHKCVELSQAELSRTVKQRELDKQERELERLRRDHQDLHACLAEEIQRMCSCITGQGSEEVATGDTKVCELKVLLRVKSTEVNYLQKEIVCLRNEVHFLNVEKQSVCERYKKVCEDLKVMKERSEEELQTLHEHLRLAMAALQEGQHLRNSLQH